ncbi:MAG: hypothetical protein RL846_48905, partial [Deltaproteobacteria bacterium]
MAVKNELPKNIQELGQRRRRRLRYSAKCRRCPMRECPTDDEARRSSSPVALGVGLGLAVFLALSP